MKVENNVQCDIQPGTTVGREKIEYSFSVTKQNKEFS